MNIINFGCKLVAILIMLAFVVYGLKITYLSSEVIFHQGHGTLGRGMYLVVLMPIFLFLNMLAAYSIFNVKKWGFVIVYITIIYSTFFFSVSYIPFVNTIINNAFSIGPRYVTVIVLNIIVMAFVAYLQWRYYKQPRNN